MSDASVPSDGSLVESDVVRGLSRRGFLGSALVAAAGAVVATPAGRAVAAVPTHNAPLVGSLAWIKPGLVPNLSPTHPYPFSFVYGGKSSNTLLRTWKVTSHPAVTHDGQRTTSVTWTAPDGLVVRCDYLEFPYDYPSALDWVLWFSNPAKSDSAVISNIQALDLTFSDPIKQGAKSPYFLHRTSAMTTDGIDPVSDATPWQSSTVVVNSTSAQTLSAVRGYPSDQDFPFYKLDTGTRSFVVALGWSGQWNGSLTTPDNVTMNMLAGMEITNFLLHSNEAPVRSPRVLIYANPDTIEANAQFRQLIHTQYQRRLGDDLPRALVYYTDSLGGNDGGYWVSGDPQTELTLLNSMKPFDIDAYIQDADWSPIQFGQWTIRPDYVGGFKPLADQALANGLSIGYGVWFDAELTDPSAFMADPSQHGGVDWCYVPMSSYGQPMRVVNFGLPEVVDFYVAKVSSFVAQSKGYRCYWQDSNCPDLVTPWRYGEDVSRQGITEIRHVMGMYDYWDRLGKIAGGRLLMKECASGGRRIDLETVKHMHFHQTNDGSGTDPHLDQIAAWSMGSYLPNSSFDSFEWSHQGDPTDQYWFDSGIAGTIDLAIDPAMPGFDLERALYLRSRHELVRDYISGAWYPLTPPPDGAQTAWPTFDDTVWVASQYYVPERDQGVILAYRRPSADATLPVVMRGLATDRGARYLIHDNDSNFADLVVSARTLMTSGFWITLPARRTRPSSATRQPANP